MRFLTGDDTGLLKCVHVEKQKVEKFGPHSAKGRRGAKAEYGHDAAERLCWAGPETSPEARVCVAYNSGALELREGTTGVVLGGNLEAAAPNVKCLEVIKGGRLLAASASGASSIVKGWCGDDVCKEDDLQLHRFELPAPVAAASVDPCRRDRLAFGGGENDVKLWDLTRGEVTWRAKGMRENSLCLRIPLKVNSIQWATRLAPSRSLVLVSTTDGKVRLYDTSAQRRPLFEMKIGFDTGKGSGGYTGGQDDVARPVNCSLVSPVRGDGWGFFCGDTMGMLREYDLRNLATCKTAEMPPGRKSHLKHAATVMPFKRGYKGIMGSIRQLDIHPTGNCLVAVGLGRYAYTFNTSNRRITSKVYLKQKLCSVLVSSEPMAGAAGGSDDDGSEDDRPGHKDGDAAVDASKDIDRVDEGFSDDDEAGEDGESEMEGEEEELDAAEDEEKADDDDDDEEDMEEEEDEESEEEQVVEQPLKRRRSQVAVVGKKRA